jgi:exopolysaccharide biosynthesis WecB/TagA/CpsF family protein
LFGVDVSATSYDELTELLIRAARRGQPATVTHLAVHALITAVREPEFRRRVNELDIVAPDGQPVRGALNWFYGAALGDRVYGPELMSRLCARAADEGVGVYLYGSYPQVVERLRDNLVERSPALRVVGCEPSLFRALTPEEDDALVRRVNDSGAGLLFVGLGCPRQEVFAHEHRGRIKAVQLCVGAAFDFHAGNKKMAPGWMQRHGMEWLYRLIQEPTRLWRRYLVTNTFFCILFLRRMIFGR